MTKKWVYMLVLLTNLLVHNYAYCQEKGIKKNRLLSERKQVTFGTGFSSFVGDIGGTDKGANHYLPIDIDVKSIRPTLFTSFKAPLPSPRWVYSVVFQYSLLRGNDAFTANKPRMNRNINFRTHNFEVSQHIEFNYYLRNSNRTQLKRDHKLYVLAGFTALAFFPQGKYMDDWMALRPFNTEGQSLRGKDEYSTITFGVPFGFGFEVRIVDTWSFAIECTYTQTFSDYLDDTGGLYYDNNEIRSQFGDAAAYFADPSPGDKPEWSVPGAIRGSPDHKDGYSFINFSILKSIGR